MDKKYAFEKVNAKITEEKEKDDEEEEEEENALIELDRVSVLAASRHSLNKSQRKHAEKKKSKFLQLRGLLLALISAILTSITTTLIKKGNLLNSTEQASIRYLVTLFVMLVIALSKNLNIFGDRKDRKLLLIRGATGTAGLVCAYFALSLLNPSDTSAIAQSNVMITAVLARIFLKEKLTLAHILSVILTITGVLLISQPTFLFPKLIALNEANFSILNDTNLTMSSGLPLTKLNTLGLIIAITDAFLLGGSQILIKKLCIKKVHFSISSIYTSYIGLPICLILSLFFIYTKNSSLMYNIEFNWANFKWHLFYAILVGLIGSLNQIILNLSLQYEEASKISIIKTSDLFFVFLMQYLFLGIKSDCLNVIGALLIIFSSFLIMIYRLIDENNSRKLFYKNASLKQDSLVKSKKRSSKKCQRFFKSLFFFKF